MDLLAHHRYNFGRKPNLGVRAKFGFYLVQVANLVSRLSCPRIRIVFQIFQLINSPFSVLKPVLYRQFFRFFNERYT